MRELTDVRARLVARGAHLTGGLDREISRLQGEDVPRAIAAQMTKGEVKFDDLAA